MNKTTTCGEMTDNNDSQITVENDGTNESDDVDMKKTATKKKGGAKSASKGKGSRGANSPLSFEVESRRFLGSLCNVWVRLLGKC